MTRRPGFSCHAPAFQNATMTDASLLSRCDAATVTAPYSLYLLSGTPCSQLDKRIQALSISTNGVRAQSPVVRALVASKFVADTAFACPSHLPYVFLSDLDALGWHHGNRKKIKGPSDGGGLAMVRSRDSRSFCVRDSIDARSGRQPSFADGQPRKLIQISESPP